MIKQNYKSSEILKFKQIIRLYNRLQVLSKSGLELKLDKEAISILNQIGYAGGCWHPKKGCFV